MRPVFRSIWSRTTKSCVEVPKRLGTPFPMRRFRERQGPLLRLEGTGSVILQHELTTRNTAERGHGSIVAGSRLNPDTWRPMLCSPPFTTKNVGAPEEPSLLPNLEIGRASCRERV